MRKITLLMVSVVFALFILSACSNNEYQEAMDKGIESLGDKDYYQSAIYFELALKEKVNDEKAEVYLKLAQQMQEASEAYEQQNYESALDELQSVIDSKNGLQAVQDEAEKRKEQILAEKELITSYENQLQLVKDLIADGSYESAQVELRILQESADANKVLTSYKKELTELNHRVTTALTNAKEHSKQKGNTSTNTNTSISTKNEETPYQNYHNERYGFSFEFPKGLTMDPPPTNGDGVTLRNHELEILAYGHMTNTWRENETISDYFEDDLNNTNAEISYQRLADNWYVISYNENGVINYKKFFFGDNSANVLWITYPADKQDVYGSITTRISESFVPGTNG